MGDKTTIEWTDATWNPTSGCDQISPGCDNCYALTQAKRLKLMGSANYQNDGDPRTSGPGFGFTAHPHMLDQPLRWKRPRRIFVNSMSDLFHKDILGVPGPDGSPFPFLAHVFAVMAAAEQHTFQVLTKRPQIMAAVLNEPRFRLDVNALLLEMGHSVMPGGMTDPSFRWPSNIWLGTSIETDRYSFRADHLRATPAAIRFISAEPLLGPLPSLDLGGIDWLIVGGESGRGARPMHPVWPERLAWKAKFTETAFFFKQWGEWSPIAGLDSEGRYKGLEGAGIVLGDGTWFTDWDSWKAAASADNKLTRLNPTAVYKIGKKAAGRLLEGRTWDEMP